MKMTKHLTSLLVLLASTGPLLSATEVEQLRSKCAEQEMQIRQLELKISRLTDTPSPSTSQPDGATTTVSESHTEAATYTVSAGDSIERISRKIGVSVGTIHSLNGLKADSIIYPGQTLKLPGTKGRATPAATESRTHTVQSGETFYKISLEYGVSVDVLIAANPGVSPRALRVGQKINIATPAKEIVSKPEPAPEPTPRFSSTSSIPISNTPAPKPRASDSPIRIDKEITYGQFAQNHNTTTGRLDELNGLELDSSTILAQGSELYIPAQP
jgi:LysM repeat protein